MDDGKVQLKDLSATDASMTTCRLWLTECALNAMRDLDLSKAQIAWCELKEAEKWLSSTFHEGD